ncbi:MAG: 2-phospho-L-lactate transferase CofD family protein [Baekduia sp.]
MNGPVVILAGGTGGAKLAAGMQDVIGDRLTVIANTGDDIVIHGGHVSPDPDLCVFWLAGRIDARGWGLEGDSFEAMAELRGAGEEVWFDLGDEDLALCRARGARLAAGERLTTCLLDQGRSYGTSATVLPMSDDPVRTVIVSGKRRIGLQEFLIRERGASPIDHVEYEGSASATATTEVLAAIAGAGLIVIGPSNPVLSIGPILAVGAIADAIARSPAPVVAVSPIVGGRVLKGPTAACMEAIGLPATGSGVATHYGQLLDALVSDEPVDREMPTLICPTDLGDSRSRRTVAEAVLGFAATLR